MVGFHRRTNWTFGSPTTLDDFENLYRCGYENQSQGGTDVKLQKIDDDGNVVWNIKLNSVSDMNSYEPSAIFYDNSYLYICGNVTYFTNGETDFFISKVDLNSNIEWFVTDQSAQNDVASDILYDPVTSSIYVVGTTERGTSYDMLLASYDDDGNEQWLIYRDYNGNIDLGAKVFKDNGNIMVHGSSQSSPTQWDITSWEYTENGTFVSEERNSGLNSSSNELKDGQADNGFIYLTGHSGQGSGKDFKVVCLDANNNYLWSDTFNKNNLADEGTSLIASGTTFIATGYVTPSANNEDVVVRKYSNGGTLQWTSEFDVDGEHDRGVDILEDDSGNLLVLCNVQVNSQSDVYLLYVNGANGNLTWSEAIAEETTKDEFGLSIESDMDGKIYITYKENGEAFTKGYVYSETSFQTDDEPFSRGNLFIESSGQIKDEDGITAQEVKYYSHGLYPDYYFRDEGLNMVLWNYDSLGQLAQTHRINVNFENTSTTLIGQVEEHQREAIFNYYYDEERFEKQRSFDVLAYPDLYDNIDAFISSNSEGFKMSFVLSAGADLSEIELSIDSASSISLNGGDFHIGTMSNDIVWEAPFSFEQNSSYENDNCVSYSIVNGNLKFTSPCEFDYPYVIQLKYGPGKTYSTTSSGNLQWSTFYGGNGPDAAADVEVEASTGDIFIAGDSRSRRFPSGTGVNNNVLAPTASGEAGLVVKFDHNGAINWATVVNGVQLAMLFKGLGLYDNISSIAGKEVHVVGHFIGTFVTSISSDVPSGAWNFNVPPQINKPEIVIASFKNNDGTLLIRTAFGDPEEDEVNGLDITPSGLMYFYGRTKAAGNAPSSQNPPVSWRFPLYDPGDGSYYQPNGPPVQLPQPRPFRAFVAAMDLNTYKLAYSSLIRNDAGSSKSEFVNIFDMDFDGNDAAYCGEAISGARLGTFDPTSTKFATSLNQTHSEFTNKSYFSGITHTPSGTVFIGMDENGSDPFLSTPNWRDFQTSSGQAFMMMLDGTSIVWDTYFGANADLDYYWHGAGATTITGTPFDFGKGKLAYNSSLSTFFTASSSGFNPVQTMDHPNFFYESQNATVSTVPPQIQGDANLNAFYSDGNLFTANHTWGTMFGGNGLPSTPSPYATNGTEYLADLETYDHGNKSFVVVVTTSFSKNGSETGDDTKFPVADYGRPGGWFQGDNTSTIPFPGLLILSPRSDITISRFEVTNIAQGVISTPEQWERNNDITVYPIPSSEEISIDFTDNKIHTLEILNTAGHKVMEGYYDADRITLEISNLAPGMYLLKINGTQCGKFIKE